MNLNRNGVPIAGYLAMLVALALALAFVATLAVVIWLPPRPPDVMRSDIVAGQFAAGYAHLKETGRLLREGGVTWTIRGQPPRKTEATDLTMPTQLQLAGALTLQPDQVRISAERVERSDVFVFRVRDAEQMQRDADRVRRQVERARRESHVQWEDGETPEIDVDINEAEIEAQVERAMRELRRFEHLNTQQEAEDARQQAAEEAQDAADAQDAEDAEDAEASEMPEPPDPPAPPVQIHIRPNIVVPTPPVPPMPPVPTFAPAPPGVTLLSGFEVGAQLPDGRWLVMSQGRNWAEIGWIGRAALVIGGMLMVLTLLGTLFARRLTRPIRNFSDAVQAVGVNPQSEPVQEEGPRELRGAARAVNTMQARLRALIADRTKTLAAVAHDMRTPLMRLRLQAENVPPEMREKMAKEIEEVEALVAGFIAFARDDPAEEARVRLDLSALLQSIADDEAEAGRDVTFEAGEREIITGQSLGLKRLFNNLVENALKYGATARITLRRDEAGVVIDVEDEGPGIPADKRESVFEPFVRLNEEGTRGAGLGLAAARSIARAHGGDIVILDGSKGALLRVTLPG